LQKVAIDVPSGVVVASKAKRVAAAVGLRWLRCITPLTWAPVAVV